ncbi:hypothetical protein [Intestinimonas timonensis]|uniref:hypothetical protein n=1 Tax=Intestinimonas timonensis TaxID=1689270 RepID=UPI0013EF0F76|nr:hypothetical protein [Intestinimonas timonensis]
MSSVLVVTVPSELDGDLYQMRNYVKESLELGVLIVGKGVQWELLELPELGGVRVQDPGGTGPDGPPEAPDEPEGEVAFTGCGAKEKRRIYEALRRYRDRHGLGSLEPLAEAAGQGLTATVLREALLGGKLPMETWRAIGSALDRLDPEG